jgi:two-component system, chemotaxis family, protein-glutamate methylesterase/glutaminase
MTQDTAPSRGIRVLVVDDSAFMRTALSRMISSEPGLNVAGTACSGSEALAKISALDPDVVTLDVEMPGLDGLQTLRCIMAQSPRPVIMVSAATERDAETTFDALSAGAFDYIPKQLASTSLDILHIRRDLLAKIRSAAHSRISPGPPSRKPPHPVSIAHQLADSTVPAIVALGTSTGGPKALEEILPLFPADLAVPILIVQHMPPGFTAPFARRLNAMSAILVREATHHEPIQPGVAYIAPAGLHMTVERHSDALGIICLNTEPADCVHVPSVDVMMLSVAKAFRNCAMGVILTGMGSDGREGMKAIFRAGGLTLGQDEADCTVYGMPRTCAEAGVLTRVVPLLQVPAQVLQATRYRKHA